MALRNHTDEKGAATHEQRHRMPLDALSEGGLAAIRRSDGIRTPTIGAYRRGIVQPRPVNLMQPIPTNLERQAAELELTRRYSRIEDYRIELEDRARFESRSGSVSFQARIDIPLAVSEHEFRRSLVTSAFLALEVMGNLERLGAIEKAYDSAGAQPSRKQRIKLVAKALTALGVKHSTEKLRRYILAFNHLEEAKLPYSVRRETARHMVASLPPI